MAKEPHVVAKSEPPKKRETAKPKEPSTQEAKDLRTLVNALNSKNSPETSKDITAYAKETLKLVAKSQKSQSAAFKREATKALIDFRNFVESTEKVTELRRAKLLNDIDSVALDTKNATMMLLSVAKQQAKNIKLTAQREAAADKLRIKELEKNILAEAKARADALESEAKTKSKAFAKEQAEKLKLISEERKAKFKASMEEANARIQKQKDDLKRRKEETRLYLDTKKEELKQSKEKNKQHYENLKLQLKQNHDARMQTLAQKKQQQEADNEVARGKIRLDRAEAAAKIKKLKSDLREDYQMKVRRSKDDLQKRKEEQLQRNKERINKIRLMTAEHKEKLKKITEEAKTEALIRKYQVKEELKKIQKKKDQHAKDAEAFKGKIQDGIFDANPLLQMGTEIFKGIKGSMADRKEKKALNRLNHQQRLPTTGATANPTS